MHYTQSPPDSFRMISISRQLAIISMSRRSLQPLRSTISSVSEMRMRDTFSLSLRRAALIALLLICYPTPDQVGDDTPFHHEGGANAIPPFVRFRASVDGGIHGQSALPQSNQEYCELLLRGGLSS